VPRRINPAVPRDLETVVLKALARDPARRYAGAADLAADLQRFLDDQPVHARRTSAAEGRCCTDSRPSPEDLAPTRSVRRTG